MEDCDGNATSAGELKPAPGSGVSETSLPTGPLTRISIAAKVVVPVGPKTLPVSEVFGPT